jgi:RNA recognition motif-containing protein
MGQSRIAPRLLFSNVPVDCRDEYLRLWVEARGYRVSSLRLIRDQVSGTSPSFAHVQLTDCGKIEEAVRSLDGQELGGRKVQVVCIATRSASR